MVAKTEKFVASVREYTLYRLFGCAARYMLCWPLPNGDMDEEYFFTLAGVRSYLRGLAQAYAVMGQEEVGAEIREAAAHLRGL